MKSTLPPCLFCLLLPHRFFLHLSKALLNFLSSPSTLLLPSLLNFLSSPCAINFQRLLTDRFSLHHYFPVISPSAITLQQFLTPLRSFPTISLAIRSYAIIRSGGSRLNSSSHCIIRFTDLLNFFILI